MYTERNFKTKKALREAIAKGDKIGAYQPGPWPGKTEGWVTIEGPHFPAAHTWYAQAYLVGGLVVKIK